MHSVGLEPTKLILIGTRTTYQATGDAGSGRDVLPRDGIDVCLRTAAAAVAAAAAAAVQYDTWCINKNSYEVLRQRHRRLDRMALHYCCLLRSRHNKVVLVASLCRSFVTKELVHLY